MKVFSSLVQKLKGWEEKWWRFYCRTEHNWNLATIPGLIFGCGNSHCSCRKISSIYNRNQQPRPDSSSESSASQSLGLLCWIPREKCCKWWLAARANPNERNHWSPWSLGLQGLADIQDSWDVESQCGARLGIWGPEWWCGSEWAVKGSEWWGRLSQTPEANLGQRICLPLMKGKLKLFFRSDCFPNCLNTQPCNASYCLEFPGQVPNRGALKGNRHLRNRPNSWRWAVVEPPHPREPLTEGSCTSPLLLLPSGGAMVCCLCRTCPWHLRTLATWQEPKDSSQVPSERCSLLLACGLFWHSWLLPLILTGPSLPGIPCPPQHPIQATPLLQAAFPEFLPLCAPHVCLRWPSEGFLWPDFLITIVGST